MGRRKTGHEAVRKIQKSSGSYLVSLPIELIRELEWQEHQRVVISLAGKDLVISDYDG